MKKKMSAYVQMEGGNDNNSKGGEITKENNIIVNSREEKGLGGEIIEDMKYGKNSWVMAMITARTTMDMAVRRGVHTRSKYKKI